MSARLWRLYETLDPPRTGDAGEAAPGRAKDAALRAILERLTDPELPLALPPDALALALEHAEPAARKAGGIYYTPAFIVDYLVTHALRPLCEGKRPAELAELRLVDPACGGGAFLVAALRALFEWHLAHYVEHEPEGRPELERLAGGGYRLTESSRARILAACIHGVDVDPRAIEVTRLSLLLEIIADRAGSAAPRAPPFAPNLHCGDALVGGLSAEPSPSSSVSFDWRAAFPAAFARAHPGFDLVLGNPPYAPLPKLVSPWFSRAYLHQDAPRDRYLLFLELSGRLLRDGGLLGVIVSNTWLQSVKLRRIRAHLRARYRWLRVLLLPDRVFRAVVDTHALVFQAREVGVPDEGVVAIDARQGGVVRALHSLPARSLPRDGAPINVTAPPDARRLLASIRAKSVLVGEAFNVHNGVKPFERGKGTPPQTSATLRARPFVALGPRPDASWSPLLRGRLVRRYELLWREDSWVKYGPWLAAPRDPAIWEAPLKIAVRQTGDSIVATLVPGGFVARNNLHVVVPRGRRPDLRYLLGALNGRLVDFVYSAMNPEKGEALAEVKKRHVEELPLRPIDWSEPEDVARHDAIVTLVERALGLRRALAAPCGAGKRRRLEGELAATENGIDGAVYALYGLTEAEIALVEGRA